MFSILSSWLQRNSMPIGNRQSQPDQDEAQAIAPLPFLPAQRPRLLTPTPSRENLMTSATAYSSFFQRLPFDIRRMILIEVFGDRTVHMDLAFDYPLDIRHETELGKSQDWPWSAWLGTANIQRRHCGIGRDGGKLTRRTQEFKAWRWFGCVCHREPEYRVRSGGYKRHDSKPWNDRCLVGCADCCDEWPGTCFVGVMGWLRTCRQAYLEGTELLYSTNRFHMSGIAMMQNLPSLLRPDILGMITSVEMVWKLGQVARPPDDYDYVAAGDERFAGWGNFKKLLQAVPTALPNISHLHVSLVGTWYPPQMAANDRVRRSGKDILVPVDDMVRNLGSRLEECCVAMPASIYCALRERNADGLIRNTGDYGDRIRRCLPDLPQDAQVGDQEVNEREYWIVEGKQDVPDPFTRMLGTS